MEGRIWAYSSNSLLVGRKTVLQLSILSIPLHVLSRCITPIRVLTDIERFFQVSLWGDSGTEKAIHWIAWAKCCRSTLWAETALYPIAHYMSVEVYAHKLLHFHEVSEMNVYLAQNNIRWAIGDGNLAHARIMTWVRHEGRRKLEDQRTNVYKNLCTVVVD